jgi:hypothetical protein
MTEGYMNFFLFLWLVGAPIVGLLIDNARTPRVRSTSYAAA